MPPMSSPMKCGASRITGRVSLPRQCAAPYTCPSLPTCCFEPHHRMPCSSRLRPKARKCRRARPQRAASDSSGKHSLRLVRTPWRRAQRRRATAPRAAGNAAARSPPDRAAPSLFVHRAHRDHCELGFRIRARFDIVRRFFTFAGQTIMSDFLFTSESVSEGHPDKVADQISDAVLDAILAQDKHGRVAAETLVATGLVVLAGQITPPHFIY